MKPTHGRPADTAMPSGWADSERLRLLALENDQLRMRLDALEHRIPGRAERKVNRARWGMGRRVRGLRNQPLPDLGVLFDPDFYLHANPDVALSGTDPLVHYLEIGWAEGRDPNALFDTDWYTSEYPGVVGNPLLHYLDTGASNDLDPSPWFSTTWYRARAHIPVGMNPLRHYLETGSSGEVDPSAQFDAAKYLADNPDVAAAGANPLVHWVRVGRLQGRPGPVGTRTPVVRSDGPELKLLLERYAPSLTHDLLQLEPSGEPPLVSVLVRTQGRRPSLLTESLLCLAAQECDDFEVVLAIHDPHPVDLEETNRIAREMSSLLPTPIRSVVVHGGERGRPVRMGQRHCRGHYCVVLDDDDHVTSDWIGAFASAHGSRPNVVLRSHAASRHTTLSVGPSGTVRVAAGGSIPEYCADWSLADHIAANRTPIHAYATPAWIRSIAGVEVDDTLPVLEDWDYLLRAAIICGVEDSGRLTALYNRGGQGSADEVALREWRRVEEGIRASVLSMPVISRLVNPPTQGSVPR